MLLHACVSEALCRFRDVVRSSCVPLPQCRSVPVDTPTDHLKIDHASFLVDHALANSLPRSRLVDPSAAEKKDSAYSADAGARKPASPQCEKRSTPQHTGFVAAKKPLHALL